MSYRDKLADRGQLQPKESDEPIGTPMPCRYCGVITPHAVLRALGARCTPCFQNYCSQPVPQMKVRA